MTEQRKKKLFVDEDEEFWAAKNGHGFDFDLDDFGLRAAGDSVALEDSETLSQACSEGISRPAEQVDWSGVPITASGSKTAAVTRQNDSAYAGIGGTISKPLNSDLVLPAATKVKSYNSNDFLLSTSVYAAQGGSSRSSSASVRSASPKREFTPNEFAKLEDECRTLKRKIEHMQKDKFKSADLNDTIRRLMKGESYVLEVFKTKQEKISLLDVALELGDGNAVLAVLLFLKRTLTYSLFQEQLLLKPRAANEYVSYLKQAEQFDELKTTLYSIGRKEDASMIDFYLCANKRTPEAKITAIKKCIQSNLGCDPMLNDECELAKEYVSLLERQQPIEASDEKAMKEGREAKFKQFPKTACLVDQSVLITLYYCCLYHYELPQNSFASPLSMKVHHKLTDKQFVWVAVKALSRRKSWTLIEQLLTNKSLLGNVRLKSPVPYDKLVEILSRWGPPMEVLGKYLRLVAADDKRLELALKTKCHEVVVDCYVAAKDRQKLITYKANNLTPHTKDAYYAEGALQNGKIVWKN